MPCGRKGLVLAGKYELVREIGRGGMGSVWQAERLGWNAQVAVKLIGMPDMTVARERFEREVCLAATLRSPHVVQVLDHGVDELMKIPFIVMELLEGESLAARLRRLHRLGPGEVMTVMTHLGRALTRAHDAAVVHRDLKPENIFWVSNGDEPVIKVLDFGVAKWFQPIGANAKAITAEGRTVGTPWYMSPEQFRGKAPIDHRIDVWSLGVIACECLTGRQPFHTLDFPALALLLCGGSPRPVPSKLGVVPAGFDAWFAKATARSIDRRFQSAQELVDALRPICRMGASDCTAPLGLQKNASPLEDPPVGTLSTLSESRLPFLRRRPKLLAGLLGGLALGTVSNIIVFSRRWESRPPNPVIATTAVSYSALPAVSVPPASPEGTLPAVRSVELPSLAPKVPEEPSVAPAVEASPEPIPLPGPAAVSVSVSKTVERTKRTPRSRPPKRATAQPKPAATEEAGTMLDDRIIRRRL